jgi:aminomethyltransferase
MGQLRIVGRHPAEAVEVLVPGDIKALKGGRARYTVLTDEQGGILDDLIISNADDHLFVVVNAGQREADLAHLRAGLAPDHEVIELADRALLALQGPAAEAVLARFCPDAAGLTFMSTAVLAVAGSEARVSRLGYTGEDGFEISVPAAAAEALARTLLDQPEVAPVGLGARDSLRLEAGLSLHGHDIDASTTPIEAGLGWTIGKRRREEGGFPGADIIQAQLRDGPPRKLVGIRPSGRAPAREGAEIQDAAGSNIGKVTSGGFGPTVQAPIAMGYAEAAHAEPGTPVRLIVRDRPLEAAIAALPFVPHRYKR